jgi:hypothetical protein
MKRVAVMIVLITVAAVSFAQNPGLNPTYGSANLSSGFLPDPYTVSLTAGGSISAWGLGNGTAGNVANPPDFDLYYNAGGYTLYIYVVSASDTTLVINTPDGQWVGNDDYDGFNPAVVFTNPRSGLYDIWVGTFGSSMASATLYISEMPPSGAGGAAQSSIGVPNVSADPTYGTVSLTSGFANDPYSRYIQAGGSIYVGSLCSNCAGNVASAPDLSLYYTAGNYNLYIYVQSNSDTTLLVNGPSGEWYGSDDVMGANPMLVFGKPASGRYDIWVGTYSSGDLVDSTLFISEMDPRR